MKIDQKFAATLLPRKPPADAEGFARHVLADLRGCKIVAVEPAPTGGASAILVTMLILGIDDSEQHTTAELESLSSGLRIVCERHGVKLAHVWRIRTDGVFDEVTRRLGPIAAGGDGNGKKW